MPGQTPRSQNSPKLRIYLADDHLVVREGLRLLVNAQADMGVIGEAGDGETAWREARVLQPDILVMDISMPNLNGLQATERLKATCPDIKVVVLSAYSDAAHVRQLLASGAKGYVLKQTAAEELIRAIRIVAGGGVFLDPFIAGKVVEGCVNPASLDKGPESLSERELEVLIKIARGHTNAEIAEHLHISIKTVETHKSRFLQKLDLQTRADIVSYALKQGWLHNE
ncbi:MAG TPA: response regulator transcription factor [Abditibacteriaceae bacterium]|jgi:DNA-binding NarL/FixJ family response regulator